ncbi:MAG: DUF1330 domain-containing protein [Gammaproteobacteria bacterium]|nr:DUF1330 domain-containing protein [Gammaproteobacteria bacterium]
MSDTPVFVIANLVIEDSDEYRKYEKGFFPLLKKHGGRLLTFDDNIETMEGSAPPGGRIIILQFPSEQAVKGWWDDTDYQELSEFRRRGTDTRFLTMVHGLPPRD